MQRGGFPVRAVVLAFFVIGTVYLLYLYNSTVGRLRDTEVTAERYRRGEETKVAELQVAHEQNSRFKEEKLEYKKKLGEAIRSKDELQEKCDNDKREFTNRLNSLNQQHKMLKSQYDEHEVEQMRLEQEAKRLRDEFEQVETHRNDEYQQLRAEKELEITRLKDQIADLQRQNVKLQTETSNLQEQLKNGKKEAQYQQAIIQNMNTEIEALKQQLELAKAQVQGQQKGNSLNFQPEQQHPQFQKNLESLGHQPFFPDQQKKVPPGAAAGGLQNGIDNMNANVGGHQENLPHFDQRNADLQDDKDETLGKNLEDGKQVINQSSSILTSRNDSFSLDGEMVNPLDVQVSFSKIEGLNETGHQQVTTSASIIEEIDIVSQSAAQSNYSSGQSTTTVPINVTAKMHQEVLDNQNHQMLPPVHDIKNEINNPDTAVNGNVDGHNEKEILKDEDHQVVAPVFHGNDRDKEADFVGRKQSEVQPLGLNPVNQLQKESGPQHPVARFERNEEEEEDGDHVHNVLQQMPAGNPPRNFGQNPPVRRMEDEEQYDKYEDDVQDDNKNDNIHINHPVENPEDDNYP